MSFYSSLYNRHLVSAAISAACLCLPALPAMADGGISIQGTRIIYPQDVKQQTLSVNNSSSTDSYLVQSWVEDASGHKTSDFVVTPPLYLSGPKNENTLRLMRVVDTSPKDRETLYYFIAKAIPSIDDKKVAGSQVLHIATATKIKLLVRPKGLTPAPDEASSLLTFRHQGEQLIINNPSPYYITMTDLHIGSKTIKVMMAPPHGDVSAPFPTGGGNKVSFHTMNDYGVQTKTQDALIK